jgi:amidase
MSPDVLRTSPVKPFEAALLLSAALVVPGLSACVTVDYTGAQPAADATARIPAIDPFASLTTLSAELAAGRITSEALTAEYYGRILEMDPALRSVLNPNPNAMVDARALDEERRAGRVRGPLHGLPILIKDNIETRELPTTAGSLALADNSNGRDAPIAARLRAAGAVILGKTNLSEWANIRSSDSISGWSAAGGQVRNPHALDRNPCGSSGGSGVAVAAGFAGGAVGTETNGSIVCPASVNGVVGMKPTVGLLSRTHIIPISHSQDTAGPMTRTVADAALMLQVMAGSDPADSVTAEADRRHGDYLGSLSAATLQGARVGVMRFNAGFDPEVDALFNKAVADLKAAGATVVEITALEGRNQVGGNSFQVLMTELKADMAAYLATTKSRHRTLADLIAFNEANKEVEMPLFGQELFIQSQATKGLDDADYKKALATARRHAGPEGIDKLLREHKVDVLIAPTTGPAWLIDVVNGDQYTGGGASTLPAVAGYPHLTVPMGRVRGLPVGLSFIGPAWSEARLLGIGHAYEQRRGPLPPPRFLRSVEEDPAVSQTLQPRTLTPQPVPPTL